MRDRVFHAEENTARVDREEAVPARGIEFLDRTGILEARILAERVEAAEPRDAGVHHIFHALLVGNVDAEKNGGRTMPRRGLRSARLVDIGDDHARAFRDEQTNGLAADIVHPAGNDDALSRQASGIFIVPA